MWIESEVMGVRITLNEETIRNTLRLGNDHETQLLDKADVQLTLTEIGYDTFNSSSEISKPGFIPPFQIGHFNELSNRMMEVVHAVVQEKPYNYGKFLIRDLVANVHDRQPFLIYSDS
ncbi:hypothetical protein Hanom_Chr14g01262551 [Helianthus anomalus]